MVTDWNQSKSKTLIKTNALPQSQNATGTKEHTNLKLNMTDRECENSERKTKTNV